MKCNLNRTQCVILSIMKNEQALDHMHSISCEEIRALEDKSKTVTIYKHLQILQSEGLVTFGAKIERANGYILTEKALELLRTFQKKEKRNKE